MLIGTHPLLTPDLLHALASMGHGDEIAVVDANFPAVSVGRRVVAAGRGRAAGAGGDSTVFPLDTAAAPAALTMAVTGDPDAVPEPVAAFAAVFTERGMANLEIGTLARHAFYERARNAFAVVRTGELREYGNVLLVKGTVNRYPGSSVAMVVVFGSINLDLVARVACIPAPGETVAGRALASLPGGKGANQALAARVAGADVAMFGAVGADAFADAALVNLRGAGVDVAGVATVAAPTGVALINVADDGENAITVVPGANALARADAVPDGCLARG